jgi:hypothetical protein
LSTFVTQTVFKMTSSHLLQNVTEEAKLLFLQDLKTI